MKKVLFILTVIISTCAIAQEKKSPEWGDMKGNVLTLNEIPPIWPGCEGDVNQRKTCFNSNLSKHISKNFKYPAKEYKSNVQGRVITEFVINEKGLPEIKNISGGSKGLQEEARRIFMLIPKMKPGMLGGKPRAIKYTVPLTFKTGK